MSADTATLPWKKLLVTTDFSNQSLIAWQQAKAIARVQPVEITVLHVTEPAFAGLRIHTENLHEEMRAQAEAKIRNLTKAEFATESKVTSRVEHGRPASVICEVAKEEGTDLIIMSSHGHSGLQHVRLGSVAADVARHAGCAVLLIPTGSR